MRARIWLHAFAISFVALSIAGTAAADYCINKDLVNLGPPAYDIAVQIPAQPITFHYDGWAGAQFSSFTTTPAGASQILHWQNLNGVNGVIPTGNPSDPPATQVHVGWCTLTEHAIENMYWTNATGGQIPDSIVLQVGGHSSNSPIAGVQWDNVTNHSFTVNKVYFALSTTDWHLADLNAFNQVLARQLKPLPEGSSLTIPPGKSVQIAVPGAQAGQSIVLVYMVTGPGTKAVSRDFVQFRLKVRKAAQNPEAALAQANPRGAAQTIATPIRGAERGDSMNKSNLSYHGGPTITSAKVVYIFWGSPFCVGGGDRAYATTLQAYRNQLGTTGEYRTITQYSGILLANLGSGTADMFDCTNPPVNVTDALVRAKVNTYISFYGFNASTIYEVVTPSGSYSTDPSGATSCGGPNLQYCAYHGWIGSGASAKKYSIQPYPSCSGCRRTGWTNVQNAEHFMVHETREAVTDPTGTGWWDNSNGYEADDKCAWSPVPFFGTGGYGYQWQWSNLHSACRQTM